MAISSLGDGLVIVAFPLLALELTKNALVIAGLVAATRLPWLVVGLPAGALVDRVDRRRLVLAVDLVRAVLVGLVALATAFGRSNLAELYVASFLIGSGETIVYTAARSIVPQVTGGDDMVRVNGRITAAQTVSVQFAGPAAGGTLFGLLRSLPFLGDALSYLASAVLLRGAVADAAATEVAETPTSPRAGTSVVADLRAGLAWFASSRPLQTLAGTVGSFALCQAAVLGVLVIYATRQLHLSSAGYGLFLAIAAVGDVLGSLGASRVHAALRPFATVLTAGCCAAGGYVVLGTTTTRAAAVAGLALEAAATSIGLVAVTSARYEIVPAERFGVVNNAFRMFVTAAIPVGSIVGGALATVWGIRPTFLAAGTAQLAALFLLTVPLWRLLGAGTRRPVPLASWLRRPGRTSRP